MMWLWRRFQIWRATYGVYRYDGDLSIADHNLPMAYLIYSDKRRSTYMPLGNAVEYQAIWGGTLVYHDIKIWHPGFIGRAKK